MTRTRILAAAAVLVAGAARADDSPDAGRKAFVGLWALESSNLNGMPEAKPDAVSFGVFDTGTYIWKGPRWIAGGTLTVSGGTGPKAVDLRMEQVGGAPAPPPGGAVIRCVYEFRDGKLVLALSQPNRNRPASLDGGPGVTVMVFRRAGK